MARKEAQPRQLPSGRWNVVKQVEFADGTKGRKSFTGDTPKEAEYKAYEYTLRLRREAEEAKNPTVREILETYIADREGAKSPSTILGYKKIARSYFETIRDVRYNRLTELAIGNALKLDCEKLSAKSVRNAYGLLFAALKEHDPQFRTKAVLPEVERTVFPVISPEHIRLIVREMHGHRHELPVLLALMLGLRMSEVIGLRWEDYHGEYIVVQRAVVRGEGGFQEKGTKTAAGTRSIILPARIRELLDGRERRGDRIITVTSDAIKKAWFKFLREYNLPPYRFHDLRAANASVMAMLGVPDKYAMQRGGWATMSIMRNVYQHTFDDAERAVAQQMEAWFCGAVQTDVQTDADS